jgi:hypothetical protein
MYSLNERDVLSLSIQRLVLGCIEKKLIKIDIASGSAWQRSRIKCVRDPNTIMNMLEAVQEVNTKCFA